MEVATLYLSTLLFLVCFLIVSADISPEGGYEFFIVKNDPSPFPLALGLQETALEQVKPECRETNGAEDTVASIAPFDLAAGGGEYFTRMTAGPGGSNSNLKLAYLSQRVEGSRSIVSQNMDSVTFTILYATRPAYIFGVFMIGHGNQGSSQLSATITSAAGTETFFIIPQDTPAYSEENGGTYLYIKAFDTPHLMKTITLTWHSPGDRIFYDNIFVADADCIAGSGGEIEPTNAPTVAPTIPPEPTNPPLCFTIDDTVADLDGQWHEVTNVHPGAIGGRYRTSEMGFNPSSPPAAHYNIPVLGFGDSGTEVRVDIRYTDGADRSPAALYRVNHIGGPSLFHRSQRFSGGMWHSLGAFLMGLSANSVTIDTAGTTGVVVADAVRFCGCIKLDNADGVEIEGEWRTSTNTFNAQGNNFLVNSDGPGKVTFKVPEMFCLSQPCFMEVFTWFPAVRNAASSVWVNVHTPTSVVEASHAQAGGGWISIGMFDFARDATFAGGFVEIERRETAGVSIADAVLICRAE